MATVTTTTHCTPHLERGGCECYCEDCYQEVAGEENTYCICLDCVCNNPVPLHPAYTRKVEVPIERKCETCGNEVHRNGTRGRWPKLCTDCKAAA